MPTPQYVYRARLVRAHDGDTQTIEISLGCFVSVAKTVRLLGLNCPEIVGASKAAGLLATQAAIAWYAAAAVANPDVAYPLVVATELDATEKYGRLLATVYARDNPVSLNRALLDGGFAVEWDGKGPRP